MELQDVAFSHVFPSKGGVLGIMQNLSTVSFVPIEGRVWASHKFHYHVVALVVVHSSQIQCTLVLKLGSMGHTSASSAKAVISLGAWKL